MKPSTVWGMSRGFIWIFIENRKYRCERDYVWYGPFGVRESTDSPDSGLHAPSTDLLLAVFFLQDSQDIGSITRMQLKPDFPRSLPQFDDDLYSCIFNRRDLQARGSLSLACPNNLKSRFDVLKPNDLSRTGWKLGGKSR